MKNVTDEEFELLKEVKSKIKIDGEFCDTRCCFFDQDFTDCTLDNPMSKLNYNDGYLRCKKCKELIK